MSLLTYAMIFAIVVIIVVAVAIYAYWRGEVLYEHEAQRDRLIAEAEASLAARPHVKAFSTPKGDKP